MSAARRRAALGLTGLALIAVASAAPAQPQEPTGDARTLAAAAVVEPSMVKLAEPALYRGRIVVPRGMIAKWVPPEADDDLTWSALRPRRVTGPEAARGSGPRAQGIDTLIVEAEVQAFRTGVIRVPGLGVQAGWGKRLLLYRLPTVNLVVNATLTPADSNADLRPVRGPIAAPWWERIAWLWVALGALLAAIAVALWLRSRRRRPVVAPIRASSPSAPPPDAAAAALAALAALRRLNLPGQGRFAEHAFHLTRILRHFLESTKPLPRPGDTTPELMEHLRKEAVSPDDLAILEQLLQHWDRVKFARAPSSVDESERAERAVEQLVRRYAPVPAPAPAATPTEAKVA